MPSKKPFLCSKCKSDEENLDPTFGRLLRAVERIEENVLEFPVSLKTPKGFELATINTTDKYAFNRLPESDLDRLIHESSGRDESHRKIIAPKEIQSIRLSDWCAAAVEACVTLNDTIHALEEVPSFNDVVCARWSRFLINPHCEAEILLLRGEHQVIRPRWITRAWLKASSGRCGCIITTETEPYVENEKEILDDNHILRSELYTLVTLLKFACWDVTRTRRLGLSRAGFLLSFTPTKVRALEGRIEQDGEIVVSIRTVLDDVPTGLTELELIDRFKEVLAWTVYTDTNREGSPVLDWHTGKKVPDLSDKLKMAAAKNLTNYAANDDDDDPKVINGDNSDDNNTLTTPKTSTERQNRRNDGTDKTDATDDMARNGDGTTTTDTSFIISMYGVVFSFMLGLLMARRVKL